MPKIAWARHLYNAYHSIQKGDKVYDASGNLLEKTMVVLHVQHIRALEVLV